MNLKISAIICLCYVSEIIFNFYFIFQLQVSLIFHLIFLKLSKKNLSSNLSYTIQNLKFINNACSFMASQRPIIVSICSGALITQHFNLLCRHFISFKIKLKPSLNAFLIYLKYAIISTTSTLHLMILENLIFLFSPKSCLKSYKNRQFRC